MSLPLAAWQTEHTDFRQLLDILETQVQMFLKGKKTVYALMSDILHYMRNFCASVHHPREHFAFGKLSKRDPGAQIIVNRLLQQHRVLAATGDEFLHRINDAAVDSVVSRDALTTAANTYLVYCRHHISIEERYAIPRTAEVLTEDAWAAFNAAARPSSDPVFADNVLRRFAELRAQLIREVAVP